MNRLQIVDHNINIGHCKVYSRVCDLYFIVHQTSQFRILNSEFRIPHFEKMVVDGNLFFLEMPHRGLCTGWGKGSKIRIIQTIVFLIYEFL